jgi:hypothetical protein
MDDELECSYRRTSFCADTPCGELRLRIDLPDARLDALLERMDARSWAYMTAFNPGSIQPSEADNLARQDRLERTVRETGLVFFCGEGVGDDGRWPPEPSILILGIARADAVALGQRFGQRAIVYGETGGSPELLSCSGADAVSK